MNRQAQLGFGLGLGSGRDDLLVTVVILLILVLIAAPGFNDFRARANVVEGIKAATTARAAVDKAFAAKGPADMSREQVTGWTPPPPTGHIQSVVIGRNGTITLRFAETIAPPGQNQIQIVPVVDGKLLDLSLAANAGRQLEWQCGGPAGTTTLAEDYRPANCR